MNEFIKQFERDTAHLNPDGEALLIINVVGIENLKRIFKPLIGGEFGRAGNVSPPRPR